MDKSTIPAEPLDPLPHHLPVAGTAGLEKAWERLGFEFGPVEHLRPARLPKGWSINDAGELVDANGSARAKVVVDANGVPKLTAPWGRYCISDNPKGQGLEVCVVDRKTRKPVHIVACSEGKAAKTTATFEALRWLKARYPDYKDVTAYWDEE